MMKYLLSTQTHLPQSLRHSLHMNKSTRTDLKLKTPFTKLRWNMTVNALCFPFHE